MHQSLGMRGQRRAGGSKSHIWAHWKEAAQSTVKLLIDYVNFPRLTGISPRDGTTPWKYS